MSARILIATARFYDDISRELEAGAVEYLEATDAVIETISVPGAFEIPGVIAMAADSAKYDGYIALGLCHPR